ncbi:response regulator transcription factor [Anaerocolumna sp. MB42-C2]|uniref:response regulator transcription factor n=1 Tax=Anaerocolumna sp. MB42-C2 TaxID=3070997 RepID=UPI0027DF89D5|nr:response regulator [Anaerocolumna sp. MB42-C2]WMJ89972.1 response regulator [Anaerocolumna sp. MB42-C2]
MLKVIIADDEDKICQLIYKLIDWDSLRMRVEAIAHNGVEAFELIQLHNPDIVITDIRMPGYDGLEFISKVKEYNESTQFIIISGYQQFEYAQKAIKYGVSDYLLKPIKKDELTAALTKMSNEYLERVELLSKEEQLRLSMKNNIKKLRLGLFSGVLFQKRMKDTTVDAVNEEYGYHLKEGLFQIITVKLDGIERSYSSNVTFLEEKIMKIIRNYFVDYCIDLESYFVNNICFCLLNYKTENKKQIRRQCKVLLDELQLQKEIFVNLEVTIGLGIAEEDISLIQDSYKSAVWAYEQRLVTGNNRVIEGEVIISTDLAESQLFYEFNRDMNAALERLDKEGVKASIRVLREGLKSRTETSGHEILQMAKEVCNIFLFSMRNNKLPILTGENFIDEFNVNADDMGSVNSLYQYLTDLIIACLEKVIEDKKLMDTKPIREAKQYMQSNYMKPITLDEVSYTVGFNATYFSSLFKKETGYTFLEYLSEVRINKAKELLKETNHSIAVICEQVGYSDLKHFSKIFTKYTNLKPNEYRKLYS